MSDVLETVEYALTHLEMRHEEYAKGVEDYEPVDFGPWLESLADDVVFEVACNTPPPPGQEDAPPYDVIGRRHVGKAAVQKAFATDQSDLEGWEVQRPLEYFANGDRVVVLHAERYSKSGVEVPWTECAMVFDVRDGKIANYLHIADMSGHIGATIST